MEGDYDVLRASLASHALNYFESEVFGTQSEKEQRIGISGGATNERLVRPIISADRNARAVPLLLVDTPPEEISTYRLTTELAIRFRKTPQIRLLYRPGDEQTAESWKSLQRSLREIARASLCDREWQTLDVALVNFFPFDRDLQSLRWLLSRELISETDRVQYVFNGQLLDSSFNVVDDPNVSIPMPILRELAADPLKHIILVSGGITYVNRLPKSPGIRQILERKLVNVLITDSRTAREVLDRTASATHYTKTA